MTLALGAIASGASAQYQVQNAGFEEWEDVSYGDIKGQEPLHWNSFITGTGSWKGTACKESQLFKSTEVRTGAKGKYAAKITDRNVLGKIYAQGNMTTGCINMGSMSASNCGTENSKGNCNYTDTKEDDFNQKFIGLPDAMFVWVKYHSTNKDFRAKVSTVLHTDGYYQDPRKTTDTDCKNREVAIAQDVSVDPSNANWQDLTIPFVYSKKDGTRPSYALVSFSTNATPGKGTGSDYMLIDDLEFIYYHALTDLKYNGTTLTGFNENVTSYDLSEEVYDASKVSFTKKGVAATVEKEYDEKTGVLTITVKGDDFSANPSSFTTYTIQFANHLLTDVKYNGATVKGFAANTYSYDLSDQVFDASKLSYTALCSGATVEQTYDELTGKVQLTVKGSDFDKNSKHTATYTLQFKPSKVLTLTNPLSVTINGTTSAPQTTTYTLIISPDEKTATLLLKNFMLGDGEDAMPIGNIELKKVTVDGTSLTTSQNIFITPGDDPSVPEDDWFGPALGQVPVSLDATLVSDRLDAVINIDMQQTLGQTIKVVLAPSVQITTDHTLSIPADALANVTFTRSFKQGWNSIILPFPATAGQLGASEADKLTELHSSYLKFEKVGDGALQPHVPYLVHFDEATDLTLYYAGQVTAIKSGEAYESIAANAADAATARFVGNYTAKFDMNGKYGIYTVSEGKEKIVEGGAGSTLPATAAYFDFQNVSTPTALSVKFGNDPTGISDLVIENGQVKQRASGVYNLQGVKLNANGSTEGLPAGVYIVNGKKVLVK